MLYQCFFISPKRIYLKEAGFAVNAVGKIDYIFKQQGITDSVHTANNMEGVDRTIEYLQQAEPGLIFTNLVDFDSKYGHRRDPKGYKEALEELDSEIPNLLNSLKKDDVLIVTADHGNDPTFKGTDHTREYIPILVYGNCIKEGINIGTRNTFADIGTTIADLLGMNTTSIGESFKKAIINNCNK